ncbi:hypothetical protein A2U01_0040832, partial [Trifolium medium]|nr:hypothetical protein [Trifolium medium]
MVTEIIARQGSKISWYSSQPVVECTGALRLLVEDVGKVYVSCASRRLEWRIAPIIKAQHRLFRVAARCALGMARRGAQ